MRKTVSSIAAVLTAASLSACGSAPTPVDTTPPPVSSSSIPMAMHSSVSAPAWDGKLLKGKQIVVLKTSKGDITLELNADAAPKTVTNFVTLAQSGYYDNLTFHRVIPGFMIQGGDPTGNGTGGKSIYGEMFEDEIKADSALYKTGYKAGVIAMANRGANTNGSQFFIMDKDYPLPPNYVIFGHATSGLDVVHAIAAVDRDSSNDMPTTPVTFTMKVQK